jgi:hypothetical protein
MGINEVRSEFKNKLAPTDSRFRPDIKALETGNLGN